MQTITTIYTDGSCLGNPGRGGWAYLIVTPDGTRIENAGGVRDTTNNRMELQAVISALHAIKNTTDVCINTDSQYVKNGMTTWIQNWKRKNWRGASGDPVKNKDLWMELDDAASKFKISWCWVRGHNGHPENERVDELARTAAERL